ncbi:hypothetical protein [Stutzerimonas frequens]|uniref:hypothetical protein n=1 Tax=Stutzerimonas frequens TaxID=2968969 RepID=UPI00374A20CE|nr:hypothetical protein OML25_00820 [Stutzerimonas stutzeri]
MSKSNQIWSLAISWISKKIRSPFSNFATRFVLILGGGIVATPLIENLLINAFLKHGLGIDLGIEVPSSQAYIAGCTLIAASLIHNLVFIKLNNDHAIRAKDVEVSVYKSIWEKLDTVLDDTARLSNLYLTYYSEEDDKLALKAEESVILCADHLRKNRPFYFSEEFYEKCASINNDAYREIRGFRGCLKAKKLEEESIGKEASLTEQIDYYNKNYDYDLARKEAVRNISRIQSNYEDICKDIRIHLSAI